MVKGGESLRHYRIKFDYFKKYSYNKHKYCVKGFRMVTTKIRSNVYLDKELKEKAKEIFKEYGLSLSDGINMLLNRVVKNKDLLIPKELDIEPIYKNDPDYKIVEKTRGEETISLEKLFELIENNKDITKDFLNDRNQPLPQEREIF